MKPIALTRTCVKGVSLALHRSAFILLLLVFHLPHNAAGMLLQKSRHAVWEINNYNMKPGEALGKYSPSRGTAFAISSNTFISNFHVFRNLVYGGASLNGISLVQENNPTQLKVNRVLSVSATYDLVLFEIKGSVENYLNLAKSSSLSENHQLLVLGYLKGEVTEVQKSGNVIYEDALSYGFQSHRGSLSGMSGGPVLNESGEVVGVSHGNAKSAPYVYVVKTKNVHSFISGDLGIECDDIYLKSCILLGMAWTEELAQNGDPIAQFQIARSDSYITLTPKNPSLKLHWLEESAKSGFVPSQYLLGNKYYYGKDANIRKDFETAFYWHQKAADQNHVFSQGILGFMYYYGQGTEKDLEKATYWMQKAADQGDTFYQDFLRETIWPQLNTEAKEGLLKAYARKTLRQELTLLKEKLEEKLYSRFPGCTETPDPCGMLIEGLMKETLKGF